MGKLAAAARAAREAHGPRAAGEHVWFDEPDNSWQLCAVCGVVRLGTSCNAPCKGPVRIDLRAGDEEGPSVTGRPFTAEQEAAIDYIVLCAVNQGKAHKAQQDANLAVRLTLKEDRRLKSHQLAHPEDPGRRMHISVSMQREAARRTTASWEDES